VGELPVSGPIARTVRDAAALLDVMAGAFPDDPYPAPPLPPGESFLSAAGREPGVLRIGRFITPPIPGAEVHPECIAAWESASALCEELGHVVEDIADPFPSLEVSMFETVWSVLALLTPVDPARENDLTPLTRWLRGRGAEVSGIALAQSVSMLRLISRAAIAMTSSYDVILTPTLAQPPALVGGLRNDADPAADFEAQKAFTPFTAVYNVTGQPAITLPLHWTPEGLPIGVQFVGRPYDERTLITLGAQIEQARPWLGRHPEIW
jgi:amidase